MPLIINGQRIDDAIIENEFAGIKAYHESLGNVSCCERDPEFRATAVQTISGRVLLAQEAARTISPTPDDQVDAALEKLMDDYGGQQWFFMRTGSNEEQLPLVRRDLDVDLRVKRMLDNLANESDKPSDDGLRAHYEQNIKFFMTEEEVRASHILKNPSGEARVAVFDELRVVRKQLQSGANFEEMAKKHSEKAEDSIDLGFFKRNELAQEVETVAFSMEVGEISPIFMSQYGLHLITLTDRHPAMPKPFDDVQDEVLRHWWEQMRNDRTRELVDRLRELATIEEIDVEAEATAAMS